MATKTGVKSGAGRSYTAAPKDNTLPSHLHEAFKLLEIRFANYDHDGAEMLMFKELERELSLVGFSDLKLEATFKRFDFDGVFTQMLLKANRLCISFGPASLSYILGFPLLPDVTVSIAHQAMALWILGSFFASCTFGRNMAIMRSPSCETLP
jgi:hypothetical protein